MQDFTNPLFVGRPNIGERQAFLSRVEDILDRRWLSNGGKYVHEFETQIAKMLGVRHCIAMCNATVGLEITIRALGMSGEVIVPSFTFIATAHSLQWQEITPVFCDVSHASHNIDPREVEALITPHTTGILAVHLWGRPCEIESLAAIASRNNLRLIFDASHAFGCSHSGRMVGGFGDAEVFSFHATKFINTLEGGAVTTNDDALAAKIRLMKNFGFTGYDKVDYLGINGKMNEVSAAMGLTNLESIDAFIAINRRNYEIYRQELHDLVGFEVICYDETEKNNYQYIVVEIDEDEAGVSRNALVTELHRHNVIARRYFYPGCHRMEPYGSDTRNQNLDLPITDRLSERLLCLPTGSSMTVDDVRGVCRIIQASVRRLIAA